MAERLGLLFADGSISLLPEGTDLQTARKEADEHDQGDFGPRTQVIRTKVEIVLAEAL